LTPRRHVESGGMLMDVVILARMKFAANITFHIPSISILSELYRVILIGVCVTLPVIVGYTGISYRVFRGKTIELHYA
jgi:cytochrome bd-type quinol oxidase subunit 2